MNHPIVAASDVNRSITQEKLPGMGDKTPQHLAMNITKEPTENSSSPEDTTSTPPSSGNPVAAPDSIPNQGLRAWMQVVGSFCLYFNTWGKPVKENSVLHLNWRR
jgi:hypothetical protein